MRLILIAGLVALALWVLISGIKNKWRISYIGLAVFLVPALVLTYFEVQWQDTQKELTSIVAKASGNPKADFHCGRMFTEFFDAEVGTKIVQSTTAKSTIKYTYCQPLLNYMNTEDKKNFDYDKPFIEGVHLLGQEIVRLSGNPDTGEQKCLARKNSVTIVKLLGGTEKQGLYVQQYYASKMAKEVEKHVYC